MIIWANLDCEARWGGASLPQHVARRVSAASALLAAFAAEDESVEIYAPAAVDPDRIKLPNVTMHVGEPRSFDLAWADPKAKAANDRRVALALNQELDTSLREARAVTSIAELDAHLATVTSPRWVCKAPWTAAGRDRAYGEGSIVSGEQRVYISRLIERFGAVMFEPWLDRVIDIGVCASLMPDGRVIAQAPHTLLSDSRGGFLGIDLRPPSLHPDDRLVLANAVEAAGTALHCLGYAGPYTVDAFIYRDGDSQALHPLCELNARHTFGHVARALEDRLGTRVLGFGTPPPDARILVAPSADDPVTAWAAS
jgi:hypothetical protein